MNEIDPNKYKDIIKKNNKKDNKKDNSKIKGYFGNLMIRVCVVLVVFFSLAIVYKSDKSLKDDISKYFFKESISFTKIKKMYDKYLGGLLPIKKEGNVTEVFNEKLNFDNSSIYYDGVMLSVSENYLVPNLEEGMVVFIGDKENYGKTIIVEDLNGIDYWYGNIDNTSLKLYDYVEKGSLIGEVNNALYLVLSQDGNYLDYEDFIY